MEFDRLRDERTLYALQLLEAGVSVELHQFAGTFSRVIDGDDRRLVQAASRGNPPLSSDVLFTARREASRIGECGPGPWRGRVVDMAVHHRSQLWFESFQNWQSEFLAVFASLS